MEEHISLEDQARQDEEIKELADILYEAIMWQVEGKVEEPRVEKPKKEKTDPEALYF